MLTAEETGSKLDVLTSWWHFFCGQKYDFNKVCYVCLIKMIMLAALCIILRVVELCGEEIDMLSVENTVKSSQVYF